MDPLLLQQLIEQINYPTRAINQPIRGAVLHISGVQNLPEQIQYAIKSGGGGYGKVIDQEGVVSDLTGNNITKIPQQIKPPKSLERRKDIPKEMQNLSNSNTVSVGLFGNKLTSANTESLLDTLAKLIVENNISLMANSNVYPIFGHGELQQDQGRATMGQNKTPEGAQFANLFRSPSASYSDFMNRVMELQQRTINAKESLKK